MLVFVVCWCGYCYLLMWVRCVWFGWLLGGIGLRVVRFCVRLIGLVVICAFWVWSFDFWFGLCGLFGGGIGYVRLWHFVLDVIFG